MSTAATPPLAHFWGHRMAQSDGLGATEGTGIPSSRSCTFLLKLPDLTQPIGTGPPPQRPVTMRSWTIPYTTPGFSLPICTVGAEGIHQRPF